ncbi:MAG: hypothetical protein AAB414_00950 [Patescibacteria group bacterium]
MKLLLLHGAGITSSRKKLTDLRSKFDPNNIVVLGEECSLQEINNNLVSTPLFSTDRLVILENPPEDYIFDLSLITYHLSLIIWFDYEVSDKKPVISWIKNFKGEIFYFPESKEVSVFPFLDKLGAKEKNAYLEMDKLKEAGYDGQYLITMIFYLLRNLVSTPKDARDFIKNKMIRMRKNFTAEKLVKLYKFVLETDFKIKSGFIEADQAEFLLVNKFLS